MGPRVGNAPEGRSAARVSLGTTGEIARASARASLLSLTPPTGMPALPDPPQHTQRRDPALTSTCRRAWSEQLARDVGCSCTSRRRLCSLRPPGGFHERYEGAKGTGLITLDYVLRKGTQSNGSGKQARICVLCDAFCSHTALPRVKGVHQPRDSAVSFSKQITTAAARDQRASVQQAGTGGEGRKKGGGQ